MEDLNLSQSFEFLNKNDSNSTDNQFIDDTSEIDQFTNQPITKPKITIVKMDSPELDEELIDVSCSDINQLEYSFDHVTNTNFDGIETVQSDLQSSPINQFLHTDDDITKTSSIPKTIIDSKSVQSDQDTDDLQDFTEMEHASSKNGEFFSVKFPPEGTFQLSLEDWNKLLTLQKGHRFMRGEWEDYFVLGMKESNKYCVFAFKDHYVNQTNVRKRRTSMSHIAKGSICANVPNLMQLKGKKIFSANGYCVFEDCPIKFLIKMNAERKVHVFYEGEIRHSVNEVHARYFRGKSRHELKEVLKYSTPMKEYLHRVRSSACCNLEAGNADYVGKSTAVYRRISSEAKDCHQALLHLRYYLIQKSLAKIQHKYMKRKILFDETKLNGRFVLGFIQVIQHIPGCVVCYDHDQICLFHHFFTKPNPVANQSSTLAPCLYISCYKETPLVSTTINSKRIFYSEMSISSATPNTNLIPLSCLFTTSPNSPCVIDQWLKMFLKSERNAFFEYHDDLNNHDNKQTAARIKKYIICDNSMVLVEKILDCFNNETFKAYSNRCFLEAFNKPKIQDQNDLLDVNFNDVNSHMCNLLTTYKAPTNPNINTIIIHTCTNQLMQEVNQLCKFFYSKGNNFNFGMYAFNVIVNSETLLELQQSMYAFMCILYSSTINSLVTKVFEHLKSRVKQFESSKNGYYLYNSNFRNQTKSEGQKCSNSKFQIDETTDEIVSDSVGLVALNCTYENGKNTNVLEECKLKSLNKSSMFYAMCEKIFEKCKTDVERCEAEELAGNSLDQVSKNPRQGHQLLYHFVHQFSATIPLWTKIFISDSRDQNENQEKINIPLTLNAQEDRFRLLHSQFSLDDEEKEKDTLDTFIKRLSEENKTHIELNSQVPCSIELSIESLFRKPATTCVPNNSPLSQLIDFNATDNNCEIEIEPVIDQNTSMKVVQTNLDLKRKTNKHDLIRLGSYQSVSIDSKTNRSSKNKKRKSCTNSPNSESTNNSNIVVSSKQFSVEEEREVIVEREYFSLSNHFGFELSKEDLESLDNSPNSNIIEFYLKMLELKVNSSNAGEAFKVLVYSVNFYPSLKYEYELKKNDKNGVVRSDVSQVQTNNIFEYNLILLPIQKCENWSLAAIDFRKQKITYYDPLLFNDFECLKHLTDYIEKEYFLQENVKYDFRNWKISNEKKIPKHIDPKDSGIFLLSYANRLVNNQELAIKTPDEGLNFRSQLKNEIFQFLFPT